MTTDVPVSLVDDETIAYSLWKVTAKNGIRRFLSNLSLAHANEFAASYNREAEPGVVYVAARETTVCTVEFSPAETIDQRVIAKGSLRLDGLSRLLAQVDEHRA